MDSTAKRVLVLGATGMLGHALVKTLGLNFVVAGSTRGQNTELRKLKWFKDIELFIDIHIERPEGIAAMLKSFRPDFAINCIGIIKQRDEAKDTELTIHTNALFPHQLARMCREHGVRLIQVSTDCVFSGNKGLPYTEGDAPDARDLYGLTKFLGELPSASGLTLRTSIVGRELSGRKSLIEWAISQHGARISGFSRALYSGFSTAEFSRIVGMIIERFPTLSGLWHVSSDPISKYDLLRLVNEAMDLKITIQREDSFTCDRRLDSSKFRQRTGYVPPSWPTMVQAMASEALEYGNP